MSINYRLGPLGFMVTGPGGSGGLNGIMVIVLVHSFLGQALLTAERLNQCDENIYLDSDSGHSDCTPISSQR